MTNTELQDKLHAILTGDKPYHMRDIMSAVQEYVSELLPEKKKGHWLYYPQPKQLFDKGFNSAVNKITENAGL